MDDFDVERFIFPDGTERDMIVFDQGESGSDAAPIRATAADDAGETHVCPVCKSALVHPTDWQRTGPAVWRITLRCPNCETQRTVQLSRDEVEHFNRVLYEGTERLARQAEQITRRHFQEESDKFVAALEADLILPIDF
jgi:hypothetical protein